MKDLDVTAVAVAGVCPNGHPVKAWCVAESIRTTNHGNSSSNRSIRFDFRHAI